MRVPALPFPLVPLAWLVVGAPAAAQPPNAVTLTVRVSTAGQPVERARVAVDGGDAAGRAAETNAAGLARLRVAPGEHTVRVARLGYAPDSARFVLRAGRDTLVSFALQDVAAELSGVVVTSTRGARRLEEEPTRVEALAGDDVAEKTEMRPADLRGFLSEMGGVRVQQTSAATGASAVRLQGLRPRYTLMLVDGLPLTPTNAGGLDVLQLPPADLRQIEVVKGPATALYGAAALGGMINLVSKRPGHGAAEREADVFLNGGTGRGTNGFGWLARSLSDRWGATAVVGAHDQPRRDADGDGWAEFPGFRRVEARPRLFYDAPDGSALLVTGGVTLEDRTGGTAPGGRTPSGTSYVEALDTRRGDAGAIGHRLTRAGLVQLRAAANADRQRRAYGGEPEDVTRATAFAELSLARTASADAPLVAGSHELLVGAAAQADRSAVGGSWGDARLTGQILPANVVVPTYPADSALTYTYGTGSLFAQDTWTPAGAPALSVAASGRVDRHSRYGALWSPRLSALVRLGGSWTARGSLARGTSAPSPYVEETQAVGARRVAGFGRLRPETADYASLDLGGRPGPLELNATLFAARVRDAVLARAVDAPGDAAATGAPLGALALANAAGPVRTRGLETYAVVKRDPFFVTALYTLTAGSEPVAFGAPGERQQTPYQPRHTGGLDVTWEREGSWWVAVEAFYTGRQALEDDPYRTQGRPYTTVGALVARQLGPARLFVNAENLTDVRQARWEPAFLPSRAAGGRWTASPWAPLEGRVLSVGVRWSGGRPPAGP